MRHFRGVKVPISNLGVNGFDRVTKDSKDDTFGHVMTRNITANETVESNVVPFPVKAKAPAVDNFEFAMAA